MRFWPTSPIHRSPLAGRSRCATGLRSPVAQISGWASDRSASPPTNGLSAGMPSGPDGSMRRILPNGVLRAWPWPSGSSAAPRLRSLRTASRPGPNGATRRCGSGTAARSLLELATVSSVGFQPSSHQPTRRSRSHRGTPGVGDAEVLAVGRHRRCPATALSMSVLPTAAVRSITGSSVKRKPSPARCASRTVPPCSATSSDVLSDRYARSIGR